jgi:uncharacterized protein (TIGR02646 family)
VRRFERMSEPELWGEYERRWLYETTGDTVDPLRWKHDQQHSLAKIFHARVRPEGEPRRCAYCDGPLGVESPETIDHFISKKRGGRTVTLWWDNLYPACTHCNSTYKREQGSCVLVRPDVDPVDQWFDFHEETGALAPAPELDRRTRARVRLTIRVLGLNATERCTMRRLLMRDLHTAWKVGDLERIVEALKLGPYRFVARKFAASKKRFAALV